MRSQHSVQYLVVDVVTRQFTEKFLSEPVDNGLTSLTATSAVFRLNTQYRVEHIARQVALVSTQTQTGDLRRDHNYNKTYNKT